MIWCSKYRRKVLNDRIEIRLKSLLKVKATQINVSIEKMEVMSDHIQLFVKASPILSPHKIAWQFKGYTSRLLREEFKTLRSRLPTLWTRSYYCESIGHISKTTIQKYIADQKNR